MLPTIEVSLPSSAEFVNAKRETNTTKRNSYTTHIRATKRWNMGICVRRESNDIKAPGRGSNEAQERWFVTNLMAEGWSARLAESAELAERRKSKIADTSASLLRKPKMQRATLILDSTAPSSCTYSDEHIMMYITVISVNRFKF